MKLIVGLGNPGEKYETTRHNLGFMVVEHFLKDFESNADTLWTANSRVKSDVALIDWQPKEGKLEKVILAKPKTYMNNSGLAVNLLASFYKVSPADIWVLYDELDLPMGALRIRFGGAAAGHHGVESIIETLGTDKFWRFRMGIGQSHSHSGREMRENDGQEQTISSQKLRGVTDYVLSTFASGDRGKVRELIKHTTQAMESALEKDLETAMNRYNTK
jgi:PTH1 family peptidyl-tRNA hydrolase